MAECWGWIEESSATEEQSCSVCMALIQSLLCFTIIIIQLLILRIQYLITMQRVPANSCVQKRQTVQQMCCVPLSPEHFLSLFMPSNSSFFRDDIPSSCACCALYTHTTPHHKTRSIANTNNICCWSSRLVSVMYRWSGLLPLAV